MAGIYQGRFKSLLVSSDSHFLTLCRYIEGNPRRARLVDWAEQWRWSGLWRQMQSAADVPLCKWPLRRPPDWLDRVHRPLQRTALEQLRACAQRGRPLGDASWVQATAARLGLAFSLRGPGRPKSGNQ